METFNIPKAIFRILYFNDLLLLIAVKFPPSEGQNAHASIDSLPGLLVAVDLFLLAPCQFLLLNPMQSNGIPQVKLLAAVVEKRCRSLTHFKHFSGAIGSVDKLCCIVLTLECPKRYSKFRKKFHPFYIGPCYVC